MPYLSTIFCEDSVESKLESSYQCSVYKYIRFRKNEELWVPEIIYLKIIMGVPWWSSG